MQMYNPPRRTDQNPKFNNPEQIAYDLALTYAKAHLDYQIANEPRSEFAPDAAELETLVRRFIYAYGYLQQLNADKLMVYYNAVNQEGHKF